jgi:hypothetical protein
VFARELIAIGEFLLPLLKPFVMSRQNAVQFFDQSLELLAILLRRDQGAKRVDSVTLGFVHSDRAVLQHSLYAVCSMPNGRNLELAPLRRRGTHSSHLPHAFCMGTKGNGKLYEDSIQFVGVCGSYSLRAQSAYPIVQPSGP